MKIDQWAKRQTCSIVKILSGSVFTLIVPILIAIIYWNQTSHLNAMYMANMNTIVVAIQTGDLVQLRKALSGYEKDEVIYGYSLLDKEGIVISEFLNSKIPVVTFSKKISILGQDSANWGTLKVYWTLQWNLIIYFVFGAVAIVAMVAILTINSWRGFTRKLILSLEQMQYFLTLKKMPEFVSEIDELSDVFQKLQSFQQREIEAERFRAASEKDRALVELSQRVAHDIKSPLSALSIVIGTLTLDSERKMLAASAFERVSDICNDLLSERRRVFAIGQSVADSMLKVSKEMELRHAGIKLNLDVSSAASILVPNDEFSSVFSNLLENAFEAIESGTGVVQVFTSIQEKFLSVGIVDNGAGIPANIVSQLGSKQLTFGKKNGNGIGFFNALKWAERSGGKLILESELDVGTRVTLLIPLAYNLL